MIADLSQFLEELKHMGVQLTPLGEHLHIKAPKGVLTPEQRVQLATYKQELLTLLTTHNRESSCSYCSAEIAFFGEAGEPVCREHRYQASQIQCQAHPSLLRVTQEQFFTLDLQEIDALLTACTGTFALDLETTGLDALQDKVVSIALGIPEKVFIFDLRPYYHLPVERQARWSQALRTLLEHPQRTWIGHNLKFDWKFLYAHFGIRLERVFDTMLVEQLIHGVSTHDPDIAVNLKKTAARYRLAVSKEQRQWFPGLHTRPHEWNAPFPPEQLAYMVQDIEIPYQIARLQHRQLKASSLKRVAQIEHTALPAIAAMELRGVFIDQERWRTILDKKLERQQMLERGLVETLGQALYKARLQAYQAQVEANEGYQKALQAEETRLAHCYQATPQYYSWRIFRQDKLDEWKRTHRQPPQPGPPESSINLASASQLQQALVALGIRVQSTQEAALEPFAQTYPVVAELLQWKKLQKFRSAFGENLLAMIGPDGRLRADYSQIGAVSGRIICRSPNLQQIPAREKNEHENLRHCFSAPAGYSLLKADLSNIELRILAEVSLDETMLRLFAEEKDLHAETAKFLFNLAEGTDTRKHLYKGQVSVRDVAKTINFGLAYGMGAQGLASRIGVSTEVAKELMNSYFATYAGVAAWLRSTAKQALQQGYAVTLAGRRRTFPVDIADPAQRASMERAAKNHPIQGTNADIIKHALALLYKRLPEDVHIILCVHDEIVLECPNALCEEAQHLLKACMLQACREFLKVVYIPEPDVLVAPYWKKD